MNFKACAQKLIIALAVGLVTACGTVQDPYKPTRVGALQDTDAFDGLQVSLQPDRTTARIGDQLSFIIKIKNVGIETTYIPASPEILLTWIYPDGKRDNFIQDAYALPVNSPTTVRLNPGDSLVLRTVLPTYYFNNKGITEFRALVNLGKRPPAMEFTSNGFGIMFQN